MANGQSRILLAEAQLKKQSQSEINNAFKNENDVSKKYGYKGAKMPLKASVSEHNHSK